MNKLEENKVGLNLLDISGEILLELLEGVSTHASKDKGLRALNAVQIEGGGGLLVARATDRFRLIEGSARSLEGQIDKALISLEDIKRIITLVKAHKAHLVSLSRIGDSLTVSSLGDSVTFTLLEDKFPPLEDILLKSEGGLVPVGSISFNPSFMADYAKIAGKGEAIKISFTGENKPMVIQLPFNNIKWRALLMPMKPKG
jgi:DNA polymerase III sliding clamp (beta) subunit (PCNA family)